MIEDTLTFEELVPFLVGFVLTFLLQVLRYFDLYPGGVD